MKEAKNDFDSFIVGNSLSNRGHAQILYPSSLKGYKKIKGGEVKV